MILAAAKIGCVLVPVMANLTEQMSHVIRSAEPAAIIGTARYIHDRADLAASGFRDRVTLDDDGSGDALVLLKARERRASFRSDPDDPMCCRLHLVHLGQHEHFERRRHPVGGPGYYRFGVGRTYRPRSGDPDSLRSPAGACRANSDATRRGHLDGCRDGPDAQVQRLEVLGAREPDTVNPCRPPGCDHIDPADGKPSTGRCRQSAPDDRD